MRYNLATNSEAGKALNHLLTLTRKGSVIDIKLVQPRRSLPQNSFLHLLLTAFGNHFGYTLEEAKQIYKELNPEIYRYTRTVRGKPHSFWRSSADLTKDEMSGSIEVLRNQSAAAGYPLPTATDQGWLHELMNEAEREVHHGLR